MLCWKSAAPLMNHKIPVFQSISALGWLWGHYQSIIGMPGLHEICLVNWVWGGSHLCQLMCWQALDLAKWRVKHNIYCHTVVQRKVSLIKICNNRHWTFSSNNVQTFVLFTLQTECIGKPDATWPYIMILFVYKKPFIKIPFNAAQKVKDDSWCYLRWLQSSNESRWTVLGPLLSASLTAE